MPHLRKIFRACIVAWRYIPTIWKKAKIVYLSKVDRITDLTPKSYPPISLFSLLKKARNIDIYHIRYELLERNLLYPSHESQLAALNVTFSDIEGAFNNEVS